MGKFILKKNERMVPSFPTGRLHKAEQDALSQTLQSVTDNGATTTNVITGKAQPTFTYTAGVLTGISYSNGTTKALTYNGDGTLNTLTITYPSLTPIVKTFNYSGGLLSSVTVV